MRCSMVIAFILGSFSAASAQQVQDSTASTAPASVLSITVDGIYLILGAVSPGVDISVSDQWSVTGDAAFGSMLFVKLNSMYSGGVRYYLPQRKFRGMYLSAMYYATEAEYKNDRVKANGALLLGGYRWMLDRFIVLDVSTGLNQSPSAKHTFEQTSGELTKSVSIGGSGFAVNARIGFGW